MKKITTYFSLIIIAIGSVSAQTNYYATSKNYAVNSVIYKCVVNDLGGVRLYAATTWQAEATQTYADGSPVNILEHPKTPPVIARAYGSTNSFAGLKRSP